MLELGACRLTDADAPFGTALDSMCSQLASAGVYTNTVLQSTSALLHALCKPEAAALLAAIPRACRDAGRFLAALLQSASTLLFAMCCMLDCFVRLQLTVYVRCLVQSGHHLQQQLFLTAPLCTTT